MSLFYTKSQQDAMGTVIGGRIKDATNPASIATAIDALFDRNILTDAERTKLSGLESSKFMGTYTTSTAIPVVSASTGSYAHVDAGVGSDVELWIYDVNDNVFIKSNSEIAGDTAASIKTKYESNANTNVFTDSQQTKLNGLIEATGVTDFTAALYGALA